jgi:phosphoglycolate phosphatase
MTNTSSNLAAASTLSVPKTLLLFDIDGTLIRSGGAGMRAMSQAADLMFGDWFKWEGIVPGGSLDPIIFAEAIELNRPELESRANENGDDLFDHEATHDAFRDVYLQRLAHELSPQQSRDTFAVLPGVHELIELLRQREREDGDIVLGLLTGNYTQAVPIKLDRAGIQEQWFSVTCYGDEAQSRPAMVKLAMGKYEQMHGHAIEPNKVIVIGDTPKDVNCAKAHDCLAFCVGTGGHALEDLLACGADVAVETLVDPKPLLDMF